MSTKKRQGNKYNNNHNGNSEGNKNHEENLTDVARLPLQKHVADFIASGENKLLLPGLSTAHRKYLHHYAARMGLKTTSYGKSHNRVLHITKRKRLTSVDEVHQLQLKPSTRQVLANMLPTLREYQSTTRIVAQQQPQQQFRHQNRRSEGFLSLGQRLVPRYASSGNHRLFMQKQRLPIFQYQDDILNMLDQHSVFIINGETGSGKTTQVPQYILAKAHQQNKPCRIVVSQPRRVAAVSVAHRVAEERGEEVGDTVGYQIRLESCSSKTTNLIYTTSGYLLRSIMADVRDLFGKVTHLIIDEIHERDKYTDFTLISIKNHLKTNTNLKVILMSATIDINMLSRYFDDCPVLNVPGQGYDVHNYYLEDILYHTGYRTALMEKYLRSLNDLNLQPSLSMPLEFNNETPVQLADKHSQHLLDSLLDQCCELGRSEEELCEFFDQLQYYIENEGLPVDAAHSGTGLTPVMAACHCNCPKYLELFMQKQAATHLRNAQGLSALDYAEMHSDGICKRILESGGNCMQQMAQSKINKDEAEKLRVLNAYQQQFNDDNEVDHDLILSLLEGLYRKGYPGAIMVFLPGYNDIVQQRDLINSTLPTGTFHICILHGQMDSHDQIETLLRQRVRKIILSTNIGQTSITIPDLVYIIDSGKVKMKTYDSITESSQLQSVWISQADANQRSGRAGRTQNGICYRLYSKAKYHFMPKFSYPEFMRIPLTEICLYAKILDEHSDVRTYLSQALNPPAALSVQNAIRKLQIMGIFNMDESVTELGRRLVEIPVDVELGKALLYSIYLKCFDPVLTIVAFHSVKDPFILPTDRTTQGQASFQRKSFSGQTFSDQMGILSLYKAYNVARPNRRRCREFCSKHFLSHSAMEVFRATRGQIAELMWQKFRLNLHITTFNEDWNMVRFCLAAGFYPNVAVIDRKRNALSSGAEKQLILQRTSALNPPGMKNLKDFVQQLPHDWIIFYEKSRLANMCAISMNTVVSAEMIVLQCGLTCTLEEDSDPDSTSSDASEAEDWDDDEVTDFASTDARLLTKALNTLSLDDTRSTVFTLDNWIKFQLCTGDAKMLLLLRNLVHTQFLTFLHCGDTAQTNTVVDCLRQFLNTLDETQFTPQ